MNETILEGMARAFFASAWADQRDECGQGTGGEIMDQIPETYDTSAWHAARTLYMDMERKNGANMSTLFETSATHLSERDFGHYAAMQAMGHGVGLGDEGDTTTKVPSLEFGSYSLERDYFTPRPARKSFNVTYDIVTDESAEHGDADERGYILENASLRDAITAVGNTRTDCVCGSSIEADTCAPGVPRWITVFNGMEYETGAYESRSLHIPDNVTPASAIRIARYLGAYTYTRKGR